MISDTHSSYWGSLSTLLFVTYHIYIVRLSAGFSFFLNYLFSLFNDKNHRCDYLFFLVSPVPTILTGM